MSIIEVNSNDLKDILELTIAYVEKIDPEYKNPDSANLIKEIGVFNLGLIYMKSPILAEKILDLMKEGKEKEVESLINTISNRGKSIEEIIREYN